MVGESQVTCKDELVEDKSMNVDEKEPGWKINYEVDHKIKSCLDGEGEISFLGDRYAVLFTLDRNVTTEDEPDDFFELTVDDIRQLYAELQARTKALNNAPFQPKSLIIEAPKLSSKYAYSVVRIQFPNQLILQGIFSPENTLKQVYDFIGGYLRNSELSYTLIAMPRQEVKSSSDTLYDLNFVPSIHLHVKPNKTEINKLLLKDEAYNYVISNDSADKIASKFRIVYKKENK